MRSSLYPQALSLFLELTACQEDRWVSRKPQSTGICRSHSRRAAQILPWPIVWARQACLYWVITNVLPLIVLCHQHRGRALLRAFIPVAQGPNLSAGCQEGAQRWLDLWTLGPVSQVWICPEMLSAHSPLPHPVGIRTSPRLLTFPIQLTWANCLQTLSLPSLLRSVPTAPQPTQASLVSSWNNHQGLLACPLASISSSSYLLEPASFFETDIWLEYHSAIKRNRLLIHASVW